MNVDYCKSFGELIKKNNQIEERFRISDGKGGTELPLLHTNSERFTRLKEMTSLQCFEGMTYYFGDVFGFSKEQIIHEIKELKKFKKQAEAFNPQQAFIGPVLKQDAAFAEYQRIKL